MQNKNISNNKPVPVKVNDSKSTEAGNSESLLYKITTSTLLVAVASIYIATKFGYIKRNPFKQYYYDIDDSPNRLNSSPDEHYNLTHIDGLDCSDVGWKVTSSKETNCTKNDINNVSLTYIDGFNEFYIDGDSTEECINNNGIIASSKTLHKKLKDNEVEQTASIQVVTSQESKRKVVTTPIKIQCSKSKQPNKIQSILLGCFSLLLSYLYRIMT